MTRRRQGVLHCLLAAAGFGAMGILAKLAYGAGLGVTGLLLARFALAGVLLWLLVAARRVALRGLGRSLALGLVLGGAGYAFEAGLFFAALERIDASLASLLLYAYPAFVTIGALLLGRGRPSAHRWFALALASAGLVLVLGAGDGTADPLGVALALGSAVACATYILGSERLSRRLPPLAFAACVSTGAALPFGAAAALGGGPTGLGALPAEGWLWIVAIAVVSTVIPIAAFFGGLARVGSSSASLLSTVEPPVTVVLAVLVFGEALGWPQVLGGALVLSGAVLVVEQLDAAEAGEAAPVERRALQPSA
ncbi:MAG: DMT family transporter [Actinomycetota bacterium]|nr:DMT family transporter [Actinomycetota bacterium]